jgi:hypothetical protein
MSDYPKEFLELAREAAERFANSPESAAGWLEQQLATEERRPLLDACRPLLMRSGFLHAIYDSRSSSNHAIMAPAMREALRGPVSRGAAADTVTENYLSRTVGGRRLGDLYGRDLEAAADREHSIGQGHLWLSRLVRAIRPLVPDDKQVSECVSNEEIHDLAVGTALPQKQRDSKRKKPKRGGGGSNGHAKHPRVAAAKE